MGIDICVGLRKKVGPHICLFPYFKGSHMHNVAHGYWEKGVLSRRRVHPRTRAGGGARWIQVPACGDAGDNGRGRSEAESFGIVHPSPAVGGFRNNTLSRHLFHVEQTQEPKKKKELSAEVDEEDRNVGGGDTGDTRGLCDGAGAVAHQFLATFDGEGLDFVEVEVGGNLDVF